MRQEFHWYVHTTYNNDSPLNSPFDLLGSPMMKALKRISSCDRGGVLGMIWDVQDCLLNLANANHCADWDADNSPQSWKATTTWETKMREVTWSEEDEHPRFRNEKWRGVFDKQLSTNPLSILTAKPFVFASNTRGFREVVHLAEPRLYLAKIPHAEPNFKS